MAIMEGNRHFHRAGNTADAAANAALALAQEQRTANLIAASEALEGHSYYVQSRVLLSEALGSLGHPNMLDNARDEVFEDLGDDDDWEDDDPDWSPFVSSDDDEDDDRF